MVLARIDLNCAVGTKEIIEFRVKELPLEGNKRQITGTSQPIITWSVITDWKTQTEANNLITALDTYAGETAFIFNPDNTDLQESDINVRCTSYTYTESNGYYQFNLELDYLADEECIEYILDFSALDDMLANMIIFMQTYTRNTSPILINANYSPANAFHSVEGRGGYFSPQSGTTEAGFIVGVGCMDAYFATGNISYLQYAQGIANNMIDNYWFEPPPNSLIGQQTYLPHWLTLAKGGETMKGAISEPNFMQYGYFGVAVIFTNGKGLLSLAQDGDTLANVYRVMSLDAKLLWQYVHSDLLSGISYEVDYWIDRDGYRYNGETKWLDPAETDPPGTIVLVDTNLSTSLQVVYSSYTGGYLPQNSGYEAFPMWRRLISGERNHALDVSIWVDDFLRKLYSVDPNPTWQLVKQLVYDSTIIACQVENRPYLFLKNTSYPASVFDYPGTQIILINGATTTNSRIIGGVLDGGIQFAVDATNPLDYALIELQNFAISIQWESNTFLNFELNSSIDNIYEIQVSTSQDAFDLTQTYTAPLRINGLFTGSLTGLDFLKFDTTNLLWWGSAASNPNYSYAWDDGVATLTLTNDANNGLYPYVIHANLNETSALGFTLIHATTRNPPIIRYRSSDDLTLRLQSYDDEWHTIDLPASNTYINFVTAWADYSNYSDDSNQGDIQTIDIQNATTTEIDVWVQWIAINEPELLPIPSVTYKFVIKDQQPLAHTLQIGNVEMVNSPLNSLPYVPGVFPFTANTLNGLIDGWQREPIPGYNSRTFWLNNNALVEAQNVNQFLADAQESFAEASTFGVDGCFRAAFNWPRWDAISSPPYNVFVDISTDPNVRWEGYQHRAIADLAESWYIDGSTQAGRTVMRFLAFIDRFQRTNGVNTVPTDYPIPTDAPPFVAYDPVHGVALIARTAFYANLSGGERGLTYRVFRKCYFHLLSQYQPTGVMAGSFSANQATFVEDGITYNEYFAFWHGEILRTLALVKQKQDSFRLPSCGTFF